MDLRRGGGWKIRGTLETKLTRFYDRTHPALSVQQVVQTLLVAHAEVSRSESASLEPLDRVRSGSAAGHGRTEAVVLFNDVIESLHMREGVDVERHGAVARRERRAVDHRHLDAADKVLLLSRVFSSCLIRSQSAMELKCRSTVILTLDA